MAFLFAHVGIEIHEICKPVCDDDHQLSQIVAAVLDLEWWFIDKVGHQIYRSYALPKAMARMSLP